MIKRMESIIAGICEAYGMRADVEILSTGRAIINTPAEAELSAAAGQAIGARVRRDLRPSTTGDDFSFLIKERPGAYVWIGNGPAGRRGRAAQRPLRFQRRDPAGRHRLDEPCRAARARGRTDAPSHKATASSHDPRLIVLASE